ncbi:MAG: hypothetical protein N2314_04990 [Brevinematales bacterium]|nr:hypothetical protein [Brevinematales bacterium]
MIKVVKQFLWIVGVGCGLFLLLQTVMPRWLALLWAGGFAGWFGLLVLWLYVTHQIHWLEDRVIHCPQCHHMVDITFLDGKPAFQRNCPYCGYDLSSHHRTHKEEK